MRGETRAGYWQCGSYRLGFERPLIMGIVNVTPDSLHDGGSCYERHKAVSHALRLVAEGADILDVGGESTRPGAASIDESEELQRVLPVIAELAERVEVPISVDTRRSGVALEALGVGASIVNNIMPLEGNAEMAEVVRESGAGLVLMHMRGKPVTMMLEAVYDDVVGEVYESLRGSLEFALAHGVAREALVVDPGIGFAKLTQHNLELLANLGRLDELAPVLVGASRKSFIGELCRELDTAGRLVGSVTVAGWCVLQGASILRVHDVLATRQAVSVMTALSSVKAGISDD